MKPLRRFFPYYGAKTRMAPLYPPPTTSRVIEPFAGSAGYSLLYPDRSVLLCDVSEYVCGVWSYLIRVSEAELMALPDHVEDTADVKCCQEARWLIGYWLHSCLVVPTGRGSTWSRMLPGRPNFWGPKAKARVASQLARIRHWTVRHCSYESIPLQRATWFVDPPYHGTPGEKYRTPVDYTKLGQWCRSLTGRAIVCERVGACWLPFQNFGSFQTGSSKAGLQYASEAVWVNDA